MTWSDRLALVAALDPGPWTCCGLFALAMALIALASIARPAIRYQFHLRRLRRIRAGLCPNCGYDLRRNKGRCPECGAPRPLPPAV